MEESDIPIEYLLQLEYLHDEWLMNNPRTVFLDGERRWTAEEIHEQVEATLTER
jgi:hypothetical protein